MRTLDCRAESSDDSSGRSPTRSTNRASTRDSAVSPTDTDLLQPRITPTLPEREDASIFQRIFAGSAGIDPYATAVSDVYQDLFQEGSFTGKGIYDVDAFASAMHDRVPENTLLSHDLFEGVFARAGLVTDVELFDEFPSDYLEACGAPASLGAR